MNNKKIVLIDLGIGNVGSVKRAIHHLGYQAIVSNRHEDINSATHLILPGVGSFDEGMKKIHANQIAGILVEMAKIKNIPTLGICLGMQLLGSSSTENGHTEGFSFVANKVKKFSILETKNKNSKVICNPVIDTQNYLSATEAFNLLQTKKMIDFCWYLTRL